MLKNRSLSLRITLARAIKAFIVEDDTVANVSYSNVAFVADVITMAETYNEKFQNMLRSIGDISIHYTTYCRRPVRPKKTKKVRRPINLVAKNEQSSPVARPDLKFFQPLPI